MPGDIHFKEVMPNEGEFLIEIKYSITTKYKIERKNKNGEIFLRLVNESSYQFLHFAFFSVSLEIA